MLAGDHALRRCQLDHLLGGEAVHAHDRLGRAVRRRGEQFERAAAVGLRAAMATAVRVRHGASGGGWIGSVTFRIPRHARQAGPPVRYFGLRASRSGIGLSEEPSIRSMPRILPDERALG